MTIAFVNDEIVSVGEPIPSVVHAEVVGRLSVFVRFDEGTQGLVRFEADRLIGVQKVLADPTFFAAVDIVNGTLSWPDERYDLCPDTMQKEIVAGQGEWVVTQPFKYMPQMTNANSSGVDAP